MNFLFLLGRNLHIVTVQVAQVSIRIAGRTESLAFEGDGAQREHGVLTMHDTITVVDKNIREIDVLRTNGTKQPPQCFVQQVFPTKPEELCKGPQGIVVGFMQDRVTA